MTRPRTAIVVGAALVVVTVMATGCGGDKSEPAKMRFACETKQCVCTEAKIYVFRKGNEVPVQWRSTGDAYCPEGYVLGLAEK
jgi:hypothetical protein